MKAYGLGFTCLFGKASNLMPQWRSKVVYNMNACARHLSVFRNDQVRSLSWCHLSRILYRPSLLIAPLKTLPQFIYHWLEGIAASTHTLPYICPSRDFLYAHKSEGSLNSNQCHVHSIGQSGCDQSFKCDAIGWNVGCSVGLTCLT